MAAILEGIFKGLLQWVHGLMLEIVEYIANVLLDVFGMDLAFFRSAVPVTDDIIRIITAAGWALLIGNLAFQALKSMVSGLGFEGEEPQLLFTRTFVFSFLLLASRQVCEIGLGLSGTVITLLQVPSSVTLPTLEETMFDIGASWLLVIIISVIIMWQVVKLFFEIGERYVVTALLTVLAPLAFAMGGSKNTADIFKGWCRMFGSMCLMMVFNVVCLKMLISALAHTPGGLDALPWTILIMGIARVARKIDSIITRLGLNPAITGDGLGRTMPGMLTYAVVRSIGSNVARTIAQNGGGPAKSGPTGEAGCGPTALAIVVSTLTGKTVTPLDVAEWSVASGHRCEGNGSFHSLIPDGAVHYGLQVEAIGRSGDKLVKALEDGKLVVGIYGPGHFTQSGHFLVIRSCTAEGKILVADPASYTRSQKEWPLSIIVNETSRRAGAGGPFWVISAKE